MRVLILYTELAGYVLGNINRFLDEHRDSNVLLIHYPINSEAPFQFKAPDASEFIEYSVNSEESIQNRINLFNPEIILCSGWSNKFYLKVVKSFKSNQVKKVICFDNQWKGTLKQRILVLISRFYLLRIFQFAWVPGLPQKDYAIKLSFKPNSVFTGLYPADTELFTSIGSKKLLKQKQCPKVLLSIARYIPQKDLTTLWKAFISANEKTGNQWRLKCIGLGELYDERIQNPFIDHLGFKQPYEMESILLDSGVFVLSSIEEPWGVVVHEMALSAMPMVLSNKVGAGSMFLEASNGLLFESGNVESLENALLKIMNLSNDELQSMSKSSFEIGHRLLSKDWYGTLLKIYNA